MDYRRADEDGSRIFLSGLSPSVDENRLYLAMQSFEGVVEVKLAKPGYCNCVGHLLVCSALSSCACFFVASVEPASSLSLEDDPGLRLRMTNCRCAGWGSGSSRMLRPLNLLSTACKVQSWEESQ